MHWGVINTKLLPITFFNLKNKLQIFKPCSQESQVDIFVLTMLKTNIFLKKREI